MGEFISVEIDFERCPGMGECGNCIPVCPVSIFDGTGNKIFIIKENEDECTLCELCLDACAGDAITIHRGYE